MKKWLQTSYILRPYKFTELHFSTQILIIQLNLKLVIKIL